MIHLHGVQDRPRYRRLGFVGRSFSSSRSHGIVSAVHPHSVLSPHQEPLGPDPGASTDLFGHAGLAPKHGGSRVSTVGDGRTLDENARDSCGGGGLYRVRGAFIGRGEST